MKKYISILLLLSSIELSAQQNPTEQARPIVEEGKRLYRSEMASWYGTDVFMEAFANKDTIGGYFSYEDNGMAKCIFFSSANDPKVIGTISFGTSYDPAKAKTDLTERAFTPREKEYFLLRKAAQKIVKTDTLFKNYKNMSLNLVPLIREGTRKVYVLTGPEETGVVIFGNDYLLNFDDKFQLLDKKQLHRNIIPVYYGEKLADKNAVVEGSTHTHSPETGDFITATDICTLMLYENFAKWKQHIVVSEKFWNIWNCATDELTVLPMSVVNKIYNDKEKKKE